MSQSLPLPSDPIYSILNLDDNWVIDSKSDIYTTSYQAVNQLTINGTTGLVTLINNLKLKNTTINGSTANTILTLPESAGANGQVLTTNGSGLLSWEALAGSSQWVDVVGGINYGGLVGIKNNTPAYELDVTGTVRTSLGYRTPNWIIQEDAKELTVRDSSDGNPNMVFFRNGTVTIYQSNINASFNLSQTIAGSNCLLGLYTINSSSAIRLTDNNSLDFIHYQNNNFNFVGGRILMGAVDDTISKLQVNGTTKTNVVLYNPTTRPVAPSKGMMYYDIATDHLYVYDGGAGDGWHRLN